MQGITHTSTFPRPHSGRVMLLLRDGFRLSALPILRLVPPAEARGWRTLPKRRPGLTYPAAGLQFRRLRKRPPRRPPLRGGFQLPGSALIAGPRKGRVWPSRRPSGVTAVLTRASPRTAVSRREAPLPPHADDASRARPLKGRDASIINAIWRPGINGAVMPVLKETRIAYAASTAGSLISTRSPPGLLFDRVSSPPWARTIERAMERPRPAPPVSRLRDVSSRTKGL